MINIQFIEFRDELYIIGSKPTFKPYGTLYHKGYNVPVIDIATNIMLANH